MPRTIDELKQNIEREIEQIKKNTLLKTFENFKNHCTLIISAEGGRIENL